jgi:hypothetical protein
VTFSDRSDDPDHRLLALGVGYRLAIRPWFVLRATSA